VRTEWPQGALRVLRSVRFRRYLLGQGTSLFGDSLLPLTISFAALQVAGPGGLGVVPAANQVGTNHCEVAPCGLRQPEYEPARHTEPEPRRERAHDLERDRKADREPDREECAAVRGMHLSFGFAQTHSCPPSSASDHWLVRPERTKSLCPLTT
jgi:hypothetical protein